MTERSLQAGWRWVAFGDVVRQVKDRVEPEACGIERFVAGEHMDSDELEIHRWGTVGDGYLGPAFHMRFRPGHVLYGSRRTYLRKVALADFEGVCANTTFVVEPSTEGLLPEFLPLVMTDERFHTHSIQQSKGSVNPYINFSDLSWYRFPLPPLQEQRLAIELIATIDDAVSGYRGVTAATSAVLTALMSHAPDAKPTTLDRVAEVSLGRQRAPKYATDYGIPYLRAANIKDGYLDLEEVLTMSFDDREIERFRLEAGDVLLSEGCGSLKEIGANTAWKDDLPGPVCFQNTVLRLRTRSEGLLQGYLAAWAKYAFESGAFAAIATGTNILHLGSRRTAAMTMSLPPIEIQVQLLECVEALTQTRSAATGAQLRLKDARRRLLSHLVGEGGGHV